MKVTWQMCALGSAFFAAVTTILAKLGVRGVDSNLATAVRTAVIVVFAFAIVAAQGHLKLLGNLNSRAWLFLVLSGLATGASWLFYFRALQMAPVALVAPIDKFSLVLSLVFAAVLLHEKIDGRIMLGAALITAGTFLLLPRK